MYWSRGTANKKYKVVIEDKYGNRKTVQFGAIRDDGTPYEQYEDKTPLQLYTTYNHYDLKRRQNYRHRHGAKGYHRKVFSPAWFSYWFLW
jgi:hypothetical protein